MRVTICGHAGLFIETESERILIDPVLRTTPMRSFVHALPRALDLANMPPPTLIVVTHAHFDHYDPETLRELPRHTPVVLPTDEKLIGEIKAMGFANVKRLGSWEAFTQGDATLVATPSGADIDEFGLLVSTAKGARFWHMSDAEASQDVARQILREHGKVDVISCKYQPITCCVGVFRCLGPYFDKAEVVDWLEAACACQPTFAFPYAWGLRYSGDDAWLNRYVSVFGADEIAQLLSTRLGPEGRADAVNPGDIIEVSSGMVRHDRQASPWLRHDLSQGGPVDWEPIDTQTLAGLDHPEEREELGERLLQLLRTDLAPWIVKNVAAGGALANFVSWGVAWQLVVHLGDQERCHYAIDFAASRLRISSSRLPYPNYLTHVAGKGLLRVLRGEAGAERFHTCGDARLYEKIMTVRDGKFWIPPVQGWDVFECLPDPLTYFLRYHYRAAGAADHGQ